MPKYDDKSNAPKSPMDWDEKLKTWSYVATIVSAVATVTALGVILF